MITIFVTEDGSQRPVSFDKPTIMVGRAEGNDVYLPHARGISRYHIRVDVEDDGIVVTDLNSTNGTYVNAQKVERAVVTSTDLVTVGDVTLRFERNEQEVGVFDSFLSALDAEPAEQPPTTEPKPVVELAAEVEEVKEPTSQQDFFWSSLKNFLAPIWEYLLDADVSEILVNGPSEVFIEKKGQLHRTSSRFTEPELKAAVLNIAQYVGRRVDEQEPYLDARLPDGSRVAVLLPPCSRKGISISIRKFSQEALTLDKLLSFGSLSQEMIAFIEACVLLKKNIIISGGTSSGKTSLLNVVSGLIPDDERILTIEDSAELQLMQDHVVPMETRPPDKKGRGQVTIRDLVRASLRMRPDRIIVGEIRGGEALDLLQAMNTGHSGSMATVHANSPSQALIRLETLALFSGLDIPIRALREQVSSAIDIVIQASRLPDHSRKVTHISEVGRLDEKEQYQVRDIFCFSRTVDDRGKTKSGHVWTGAVPQTIGEMELAGLTDIVRLFKR